MNYNDLKNAFNTTENMEVIRNNVKNDDSVDTLTGVDWFKFNNKTCTSIYVSGNSYLGFGSNTAHLKICNRDGASYSVYRQEGTLFQFYKFLKIRWEGYTIYSSTSTSYRLIYEVFLFDTGNIFVNLIQVPTNSSYLGTSTVLNNNINEDLGVKLGTPDMISLYSLNNNGTSFDIKHELINIPLPFTKKYLIRSEGKYYTLNNNILSEIQVDILNAEMFETLGFDEPENYEFMKVLKNPDIINWCDTDLVLDHIDYKISAIPYDQILTTESYDCTDYSIDGVESITIEGDAEFQFSFDKGNTFVIYQDSSWISAGDVWMTKEEVQTSPDISFNLNTIDEYMVKIKISNKGSFKSMLIKYKNGV